MAIVVEDGTARADAVAYASADDADGYHAARGNAAWAALSPELKEQCLVRATDYLQGTYRNRWQGYRVSDHQGLDWPRFDAPRADSSRSGQYGDGLTYYASTDMPVELLRACAELALRAATGELDADLQPPVLSESVGPISTTYAQGARQSVRFPAVEKLLKPLLRHGRGTIPLERG